jgi:hypothetical protein
METPSRSASSIDQHACPIVPGMLAFWDFNGGIQLSQNPVLVQFE